MNQKLDKYAGAGQDTIEQKDKIPYLRVLQANSVELDPTKEGHDLAKIEGAKAGSLYHPVLGLLPDGIEVVPVMFDHFYEEQTGKGDDTRTVGRHPVTIQNHPNYIREKESEKKTVEYLQVTYVDNKGQKTETRNRLAMTILMGVLLPEYNNAPAVIKFQSMGLGIARDLQKSINRFRYPNSPILPPVFSRIFKLSTGPARNELGSWMAMEFSVSRVLDVETDEALMDCAFESLKAGSLQDMIQSATAMALPEANSEDDVDTAATETTEDDNTTQESLTERPF